MTDDPDPRRNTDDADSPAAGAWYLGGWEPGAAPAPCPPKPRHPPAAPAADTPAPQEEVPDRVVFERGLATAPSHRRPRSRWPFAAGVGAVVLVLAGGVLYAMVDAAPSDPQADDRPPSTSRPSAARSTPAPAVLPAGFAPVDVPGGDVRVGVPEGWERLPGDGPAIAYDGDGLDVTLVPGRDAASRYDDALAYQAAEPELEPFRDAEWAAASGQRLVRRGGGKPVAEGVFEWKDDGRRVLACNRAFAVDGAYHVVLVKGPAERRADITEACGQILGTYAARD